MDDKKYNLFCRIMEELDKTYDLMTLYDSLPHQYGDYNLYQVESHIIECIGNNEGVTISILAEKFGKTKSACSQMVKKLRDKNWVIQVRNEKNNREYKLYLTEEGKKIFKNHAEFDQRCYIRNFKGLKEFSYEELNTYLRIQKKMNQSFELDVEESHEYFQ